MTPPKKPRRGEMDAAAQAFSGQMGKTIQRLRHSYNLSLSELSEQSGVAKSIISQIERNETNPTLATIWRLSQALDVSIDRFLSASEDAPFIEKTSRADTPAIVSEDGKCVLTITGWIKTVEWLQWYDLAMEAGAELVSEPHQRGAVESLSVRSGEVEVEVNGHVERVGAGESLRYRCDVPHAIRNRGTVPVQGTLVCLLKAAVMD